MQDLDLHETILQFSFKLNLLDKVLLIKQYIGKLKTRSGLELLHQQS
jgi:hypothetical protein